MNRLSRPRVQPRLEILADRCTPSTMSDFFHAWDAANAVSPPSVSPALGALFNPPSSPAVTAALAPQNPDTRVVPFKISGSGFAPQGLPEVPGTTGSHTATGTATELGKYTGNGLFQLLSIDLATLPGTFQGAFTFVAANGDQLAMNYGANPNNPGQIALIPMANGQFVAVFVAEFTPDAALSTGRFANVIGGGFTMVAVSEPFDLSSGMPGYTAPFAYSWAGEGSLVFSTGS
jgi:hypothetical protein